MILWDYSLPEKIMLHVLENIVAIFCFRTYRDSKNIFQKVYKLEVSETVK